jgi:hypothetical protein
LNNFEKPDAPKYVLINVSSSMTVWELYNLLAKHVDKSPLSLNLHRMKDKDTLSDYNYSKTLSELKVEDKEEFYVNNRFKSKKQVPLSSELTKDITVQAKYQFTKWFEKYSVVDEELDERVMTKETCMLFFESCARDVSTVKVNQETRLKAVNDLFLEDHDCDEKLKLKDFLNFYKK